MHEITNFKNVHTYQHFAYKQINIGNKKHTTDRHRLLMACTSNYRVKSVHRP